MAILLHPEPARLTRPQLLCIVPTLVIFWFFEGPSQLGRQVTETYDSTEWVHGSVYSEPGSPKPAGQVHFSRPVRREGATRLESGAASVTQKSEPLACPQNGREWLPGGVACLSQARPKPQEAPSEAAGAVPPGEVWVAALRQGTLFRGAG